MPIRKGYPVHFTPQGLSDAFDATAAFQGACKVLQNLIFDQANPELVVSRPGVGTPVTSFGSFNTPTFVSGYIVVGNLVYGTVSTARNANADEPFVFNLATNSFVTVSGVLASNVPTSPSTSGAWTPPTLAVIGSKVIVTHPGFSGSATNAFGWIDFSSFTASITGNTTSGSNQITAASSTTGLLNGMAISGTGIPAGSVITAVSGSTISISQTATANGTGVALTVTGGTPAAPAWGAGNTATNALPSAATAVANYNNRAYFAVGNVAYFSDVLNPTTRTNASQSVTLGDTTPITAFSGLPVQTLSGGVQGALIAFKASQTWQITGDPTTNTLAVNYISLTTGCSAPRSVVQAPFGTVFIGVDAPYILGPTGILSALSHSPLQDGSPDLQVPFQNTTQPSRMAAAFAGNVYRVCVPTVLQGNAQTNDYWYDIRRKRWNGPHTFVYDNAAQYGSSFVLSGAGTGAALFVSQSLPSQTSTYKDNGAAIQVTLQSSTFPKPGRMTMKQIVESTLELASGGQQLFYNVTALDDQNSPIGSTGVVTLQQGTNWGSNAWGDGSVWRSSVTAPHTYNVPWLAPLVFKKMALQIIATSASSIGIGTFAARYQDAGYTNRG